MQEVGRELKVRYALEGSIQRQGDRIRVTAQLIDTETAAHVWSERWDRPATDVFAVQTEVAEKVAGTIGGDLTMGQITRAELQRAKRLRPTDLKAYDLFYQPWEVLTDAPLSALRLHGQHRSVRSYQGWYECSIVAPPLPSRPWSRARPEVHHWQAPLPFPGSGCSRDRVPASAFA